MIHRVFLKDVSNFNFLLISKKLGSFNLIGYHMHRYKILEEIYDY